MNEMASTYAALMISDLLHLHALANMHRASGRDEYRTAAADWLPALERHLANLKRDLTKAEGLGQLADATPNPTPRMKP